MPSVRMGLASPRSKVMARMASMEHNFENSAPASASASSADFGGGGRGFPDGSSAMFQSARQGIASLGEEILSSASSDFDPNSVKTMLVSVLFWNSPGQF